MNYLTIPEDLIRAVREARRIAIITGAGVSAESGVPTFRGSGGLWRQFRAEDLATPAAFARDPLLVWEWYAWRRSIIAQCRPNPAHRAIARLETEIDDVLLITQNVDGLHRAAGSRQLLEIHGNIWHCRCTVCGKVWEDRSEAMPLPPHCSCGAIARPHIVWFGENYEDGILEQASDFLTTSDLVLVVGTSGMVHTPVALTARAKQAGAKIVELSLEPTTGVTPYADWVIQGPAGETLPALLQP